MVGYWGGFLGHPEILGDAQERQRLRSDPRYRRQSKLAAVVFSGKAGSVASGVVALLTDFGDDYYVGVMKGVLARRAPFARVIDLSHRIAPGRVAEAAYVLASAVPYFPPRTVFCCVVDPGVGGPRRRLAVRNAGGAIFVAPDNGLLTPILDADGGVAVRAIENPAWTCGEPSSTFQGRSHFAPAAAALVAGAKFEAAGPVVTDPVMLPEPRCVASAGRIEGEVVYVDAFGNLVTSIDRGALERVGPDALLAVAIGGRRIAGVVRTYGDGPPQGPMAYVGSTGRLEIAVRDGNAARELGLGVGADVDVSRG